MQNKEIADKLANSLFPYFLIIVIGVICYSGTFDNPFNFDDFPSIIDNRSLKNISDLGAIWRFDAPRFVVYLTFALNYHIHGLTPFGYHLVNLIVHISAALTVYWLVGLLFVTPELKMHRLRKQAKSIALVAALLFVSHPVQTQAVTYIVQRTTSLAALFYMLSIALYIKSRIHLDREERVYIRYYAISLISAVLAMFTKEIAITLPVCILVCEYYFYSPSFRPLVRKLSYYWWFLLLVSVIPLTYVLSRTEPITAFGFAAETDTIGRTSYLFTQFNVIKRYLGLLFFPVNQSIDYAFPIAHDFFEPTTFISFIVLASLFVLGVVLFTKFRLVSFGIIWFFLTLTVESSLIPIRDVISEHRLYLPSFGIFLSVSCLMFHVLGERRKIIFALSALMICSASFATIHRNVVWNQRIFLWQDAVAKDNIKGRTMNNLGVGLLSSGGIDQVVPFYDYLAQRFPMHAKIRINRAKAYHMEGNIEKAIDLYSLFIKHYPGYHRAYYYRGIAYAQASRHDKALADFNTSIKISGEDSATYYNRSCLYVVLGKYNRALKDVNQAIEMDKDKAIYYRQRGLVHKKMRSFKKALEDLNQAVKLSPGNREIIALREEILRQIATAQDVKSEETASSKP